MNNLQFVVKDNSRYAMHIAVELCEQGDFDSVTDAFRWLIQERDDAELGSEQELIDLAHNAWSMALCAMQGMPIPAGWGNAVEHGLRKYGINVDEELTGFEVIDE